MYTYKSYVSAAAVLLLAACQSKEISITLEEVDEEQKIEAVIPAPDITAVQEVGNNTKSTLEVDEDGIGTIYWTPADEINVFYGTTSTHYVSQNSVNATTAVFSTTDIIGINEGASENIWGLYPYNSSATCTGAAVTTTLPATQYGVAGTFDDDLYITLAHNNSTALAFYNVCGGIKFSLSRDDITSITFRGNNNEDIAGDISLNFVDGLPNVNITSGQKEISLTPKDGSTFVSGKSYYLVILPVTLSNGFTMKFTTSSSNVGIFNYSSAAVTIKRSIFGKKTNIDSYASFPAPGNQIWYTSTDENVINPYDADAFGATIISNEYADGKGVITFDSDITAIGSWAFYNCSTLRSIVFPKSVLTIGASVLNGNPNLQTVILPEGLTSLGSISGAGMEYIELPSSLLSFGGFSSCENLKEIRIPNSCTTLTEVAPMCSSLKRVIIPEGVTSLPRLSFFYCKQLTDIHLPSTLETIGDSAFSGCSSLTSINIPDGVTSLELNTFSGCSGLSNVTLSDNIETIGQNAFYGCKSLESITLPSHLSNLGVSAFENCSSLNSIIIQSSFSSGYNAFGNCPGGRCYYVDDLSIWLGLSKVPSLASNSSYRLFVKNVELQNLTIPNSAVLNAGCFFGCSSIQRVTFPGVIETVPDNSFQECPNLIQVTLNSGVRNIGRGAFESCWSLSNVYLTGNDYGTIRTIGDYAFCDCGISWLNIPNSVTSIGDHAFRTFKDMSRINVYPSTPPTLGKNAFDSPNNCPIFIFNSYEAYKGASSWSLYASRMRDYSYDD